MKRVITVLLIVAAIGAGAGAITCVAAAELQSTRRQWPRRSAEP